MKRAVGNDLESRMRKKAALDLKAVSEREEKDARAKSAVMHQCEEFCLGDDFYVVVNSFKGFTRVHIRKYVPDNDGCLRPTKDGISVSPIVWNSLIKEFFKFRGSECLDNSIVVNRDLCVSAQSVNGEQVFVLQRLFQRKNLRFEFTPKHIVLNRSQFTKLVFDATAITNKVCETLIKGTLCGFIYDEMNNSKIVFEELKYPFIPDVTDSLVKCIATAVTLKISELYDSREKRFMQDFLMSRAEKFNEFFDQSLFQLDWHQIAKDFVEKNNNCDISTAIHQEEFFDGLDIIKLFNNIEKMYINEEENTLDNLMLSIQ